MTEDAPKGSSRVARRRDRRKAEIVRTATLILAESGYQGMNLDAVAEQTDIAKATLYHYFPSKEVLVGAALEATTQEVLARLNAREEELGPVSAREHLAALIDEQIRILTETAPEVAAVFAWPRGWPAAFDDDMKDMRRRHDAVFRRVVEKGLAAGEFNCPNIDVALQCLHGILNQSSVWLRPGARAEDRAQMRAAIVNRALRVFD
ncbi:TetR/AcrR family transcriptional regulator [Mycolicibacter sinensis]|uniref:TetR/AcrR family transcriptional regulator n=1 Tax=Mycolicibacter sinensis (strain JDM601) TaxID=875328 RepID=UPI0009EDD835|nr:TetR/AcrR family transcriptional regulator [Mycolicibacter sinensis]